MKSILFFCLMFTGFFAEAQVSKNVISVQDFQEKINKEFKSAEHSPLPIKARKKFTSLEFFPVDTTFIVTAEFVRTPFETPFEMPTTTDRKPLYVKYGELYFSLNGKEFELDVFQSQQLSKKAEYKDYLFLPFTDLTNGNSSYSGGRYLDLKIPKTNRMLIDFNKAYNPYCAYSGEYSCPIPPEKNHLEIPVTAGVMAYEK